MESRDSRAEKTLLIILAIVILGPIIFVGTCLPIGYLGFGLSWESSSDIGELIGVLLFYGAWVIGAVLAILGVKTVIKRILKRK
jgi:hypothetical protein